MGRHRGRGIRRFALDHDYGSREIGGRKKACWHRYFLDNNHLTPEGRRYVASLLQPIIGGLP